MCLCWLVQCGTVNNETAISNQTIIIDIKRLMPERIEWQWFHWSKRLPWPRGYSNIQRPRLFRELSTQFYKRFRHAIQLSSCSMHRPITSANEFQLSSRARHLKPPDQLRELLVSIAGYLDHNCFMHDPTVMDFLNSWWGTWSDFSPIFPTKDTLTRTRVGLEIFHHCIMSCNKDLIALWNLFKAIHT